LSPCGNFAVIGYDSGHADKFNIQSGKYRGAFIHHPITKFKKEEDYEAILDDPAEPIDYDLGTAHNGPVRGKINYRLFGDILEKSH
jgi:hypothetical protein